MVIQFKVKESKLSQLSASWVVSNNYNYIRAQFNFASSDWDEKGKTAVFNYNGREYPVTLDRNDSCRVPWEVLMPPFFNVYVVGGDLESEMIYTNSCPINVHPSGSIHIYDNNYRNPTPDVYQQVVDLLAQKQDKLTAGDNIEIDETCKISIADEFVEEINTKFAEIDASQVDNIMLDVDTNELWLVANGEQIGDKIALEITNKDICVKSVNVDSDGNLIVVYTDNTEHTVGKLGSDCAGVYIPSYKSNGGILTFTLSDKAENDKYEFDIKDTDNWHEIDSPEAISDFVWEEL